MRDNGLTSQRARYAQLVASGLTQADAYRQAYPRSQKWTNASVAKKASELMADERVSGRVAELQKEVAKGAVATARDLAEGLTQIFLEAKEKDGNRRIAIQAAEVLSKLLGYNAAVKTEARVETVANMSDERMEEILRNAGRLSNNT